MNHPQELDSDRNDSSQVTPEASEPVPPLDNRITASNTRVARKPPSKTTPEGSLVPELSDEDLWLLIRRFNKQICHVRATTDAPPHELDLNRADDEQFPAEKLRMTVERFYTSVVVGAVGFWRHVARLRSWKEKTRTSVFCVVYFVAWAADLLVPAILGVLVALIWCPRLRPLLFPAAAPVQVQGDLDATNAKKQQQPTAGESAPAPGDSITGAPEAHKGEAAEQEANQLVNSLAGVAIEGAAGRYDPGVAAEDDVLVESNIAAAIADAGADADAECLPADSKAKKPMKRKMSTVTDQMMCVVSDVTDIYEKFANALSPTPPFYAATSRLRLVGVLISVGIMSLTPSYWMIKATAFVIGFGLFGDPVVQRTVELLNSKVPDWKEHMDMRKTLLKGVPTNAQLTLTLLRIGEINSLPLPPPPSSQEDESSWPIYRNKFRTMTRNNKNNNNHDGPVDNLKNQDKSMSTEAEDSPSSTAKPKKRRWVVKTLSFIRRTIATAIKGHATLDRAIAIVGSAHTKTLRGMLQNQNLLLIWHMAHGNNLLGSSSSISSLASNALKFDAKFERKRGAVVVDDSVDPPVLYFTTYQSAGLDDLRLESRKKSSVLFQLPVTEVRELKKTKGLGWKGKLIVELTAGSKEAVEGLVISGSEPGQCYQLTGMRERNQLFNRLVAMGVQFWESC